MRTSRVTINTIRRHREGHCCFGFGLGLDSLIAVQYLAEPRCGETNQLSTQHHPSFRNRT